MVGVCICIPRIIRDSFPKVSEAFFPTLSVELPSNVCGLSSSSSESADGSAKESPVETLPRVIVGVIAFYKLRERWSVPPTKLRPCGSETCKDVSKKRLPEFAEFGIGVGTE
jgi:hypothetical protein